MGILLVVELEVQMPCGVQRFLTHSLTIMGTGPTTNEDIEDLTEREMEVVMSVFKSFETGLREATIYPKVLNITHHFNTQFNRIFWRQ